MAITWLLDVDGVVCPLGDAGHPNGWTEPDATATVAGMAVWWAPQLVTAIRDISSSVQICWLTSWQDMAAQLLAPVLGLPEFAVLTPPCDTGGLPWKAAAALHVLTTSRQPLIWTDDNAWAFTDTDYDSDAAVSSVETLITTAAADCGVPLLLLAPPVNIGLTPQHLTLIRQFVTDHS